MSKPTLVLLSGGLDSTTLLHHVVRDLDYTEIHAITYNYGQKHSRELEAAEWQAAAVEAAHHRVIDVSFLGDLLKGASALVIDGETVPDLEDIEPQQRDQPPTYVPNRNMMLLSIAASYAEAKGIQDVYYGAQAQDEYGYWDCTTEFLERLNQALALNRRAPIVIHAPFIARKKADILKIGMTLGVDYAHTWSCYRGVEKSCGACPTCVERLNAFRTIGIDDPLPYDRT